MIYDKYIEQFDKIGYSDDSIILIPNFLNKEKIEILTKYLKEYRKNGPIHRSEISNQEIVSIIEESEQKIYEIICTNYTDNYNVKFEKEAVMPLHLLKWELEKNDSLPPHSDCEKPDGSPAIEGGYYKYNLATICYLNDDYVGGEIFFLPYFKSTNQTNKSTITEPYKKIKAKAGDLIMFPSRLRHGVTAVQFGERYTMPSWYRFDIKDNTKFKNLPDTALGVLFNEETGS